MFTRLRRFFGMPSQQGAPKKLRVGDVAPRKQAPSSVDLADESADKIVEVPAAELDTIKVVQSKLTAARTDLARLLLEASMAQYELHGTIDELEGELAEELARLRTAHGVSENYLLSLPRKRGDNAKLVHPDQIPDNTGTDS